MKIIVGLGNIGEKYENTRHNAGFIILNKLAEQLGIEWKLEKKLKSIIAKDNEFYLVKPTTFMNLSGEAVIKVLNFYKSKPSNLIVVYDDIDLPLGKYRIRPTGSAGTHNGMKSIISQLGTKDFERIRIGIESRGVDTPSEQDLSSFVLSKFNNEEIQKLNPVISQVIDYLLERKN